MNTLSYHWVGHQTCMCMWEISLLEMYFVESFHVQYFWKACLNFNFRTMHHTGTYLRSNPHILIHASVFVRAPHRKCPVLCDVEKAKIYIYIYIYLYTIFWVPTFSWLVPFRYFYLQLTTIPIFSGLCSFLFAEPKQFFVSFTPKVWSTASWINVE